MHPCQYALLRQSVIIVQLCCFTNLIILKIIIIIIIISNCQLEYFLYENKRSVFKGLLVH